METFQADLDVLQNPLVSVEEKEWMLDIIFSQIVPYRYHQEPRLFPDLAFYGTLLNNRPDFLLIWNFVTRFHTWIYDLAISSSAMADQAIESLSQMRDSLEIDKLLSEAAIPEANLSQYPSPPGTTAEASAPATPQETPCQAPRAPKATKDEAEHPLLAAELKKPPTFIYEGTIRDLNHFAEIDAAYNRHMKRQPGMAPAEDQSWPSIPEKCAAHVREMYKAITMTDDFFELRKAKERLLKVREKADGNATPQAHKANDHEQPYVAESGPKKRKSTQRAGDRPKGLSKADWDLLDDNNSPADRLSVVIHHKITNIEIEILCWRLLLAAMDAQLGHTMKPLWSGARTVSTWDTYGTFGDRWSAMCKELLDCKILVHSLLRADWFAKFASAPNKERAGDLAYLQDESVPPQNKVALAGVILDVIKPYRLHDTREFPNLGFFEILLLTLAEDIRSDATAAATSSLDQDLMSYLSRHGAMEGGLMDATGSPPEVQRHGKPSENEAESQHQFIKSELVKPATLVFRGIVRDAAHVNLLSATYEKHARVKEIPELDATFPTTAQQDTEYVGQIFAALVHVDTSDFYEKQRAIEKKSQNSHLSKVEAVLSDPTSTNGKLLSAVLHYQMSDLELELLAWTLLEFAIFGSKGFAKEAQRGFLMSRLWAGKRLDATRSSTAFRIGGKQYLNAYGSIREQFSLSHKLKLSNSASNAKKNKHVKLGRELANAATRKSDCGVSLLGHYIGAWNLNPRMGHGEGDNIVYYDKGGSTFGAKYRETYADPPSTAKGRRGAGHWRRPRAAPYPDRKRGPANEAGAKTPKSQHKAQTFPSGLGNLVDIAEAPKLTSIFVGWRAIKHHFRDRSRKLLAQMFHHVLLYNEDGRKTTMPLGASYAAWFQYLRKMVDATVYATDDVFDRFFYPSQGARSTSVIDHGRSLAIVGTQDTPQGIKTISIMRPLDPSFHTTPTRDVGGIFVEYSEPAAPGPTERRWFLVFYALAGGTFCKDKQRITEIAYHIVLTAPVVQYAPSNTGASPFDMQTMQITGPREHV
ncbi:hypothetical protein CcaCcLH18_02192 [Colletotrichum camelliae]|nr:hypothetical protein CcaCcLH18_02192 [Colletotrichum camelliae]